MFPTACRSQFVSDTYHVTLRNCDWNSSEEMSYNMVESDVVYTTQILKRFPLIFDDHCTSEPKLKRPIDYLQGNQLFYCQILIVRHYKLVTEKHLIIF